MEVVDVLKTILHEHNSGRRAALCTIVATRGSTPQPAGTIVCVDEAAKMIGSLGGGCMEADVRREAHRLLSVHSEELLTFTLDNDFGHDDGMICGGHLDVAIQTDWKPEDIASIQNHVKNLEQGREAVLAVKVKKTEGVVDYRVALEPTPRLVIAGAGHISRTLATIAVASGFDVSVIDERADLNNAERFAPPIRSVVGDIGNTLREFPIDANTFVVIVTRGHKHDEVALAAVLDSPARYIGMIGSKRKINVIFEDLRHGGANEEQLARVNAPIGIDIGAVTANEIAVSIAAQLIAERRKNEQQMVNGSSPKPDVAP